MRALAHTDVDTALTARERARILVSTESDMFVDLGRAIRIGGSGGSLLVLAP
jgi:hypothetical protein